jgi:hypothetical protein
MACACESVGKDLLVGQEPITSTQDLSAEYSTVVSARAVLKSVLSNLHSDGFTFDGQGLAGSSALDNVIFQGGYVKLEDKALFYVGVTAEEAKHFARVFITEGAFVSAQNSNVLGYADIGVSDTYENYYHIVSDKLDVLTPITVVSDRKVPLWALKATLIHNIYVNGSNDLLDVTGGLSLHLDLVS